MIQNTKLAKTVYELSGLVSYIKTPRRVFSFEGPGWPLKITFEGWRWLPTQLTQRLLTLSERLDENHWSHWALVHENCGSHYCLECHGQICGDRDHD